MTIAVITGTRPEIIKMYPIIKLLDSRSIEYKYIHTGQHYDYNLFLKFIEEFEIRKPDICVSADVSNPVMQVASMMEKIGGILNELRPSMVLVEGDTNSVLASALAALKSNIPIGHVEAGLRSNDWKTVEEHNRRIVDHVSNLLFAPTDISAGNLQKENVHGKIYTVGNPVIDAIKLCLAKGKPYNNDPQDSNISISEIDQYKDDYILVTMHRSENVDQMSILNEVLAALSESKQKYIFPVHPHTLKRIQQYGIKNIAKGIHIIKPVGYFDFLNLLKNCKFVITDSGGIQEEITSPQINKRALVLRDYTERPESVNSDHSVLCKIDRKAILKNIMTLMLSANIPPSASPYGLGNAAKNIVKVIENKYH